MTAVILALLGIFTLGRGPYASAATIILIIDAYIGLTLFSLKNSMKIRAFWSGLKKTSVIDEDNSIFIRA